MSKFESTPGTYTSHEAFVLECGDTLQNLTIQYHTIGQLNDDRSNVVWIFHALTGNSDPSDWWPGLIAEGNPIDPSKHFIICANVIGSCYGSTEPDSYDYPLITMRDMVAAHELLREKLNIASIYLGIGGSLGGQQLLEWAVQKPDLFKNIVPIATNAYHSAWGIAFNEAQRMAMQNVDAQKGLEAARAIAMLSYRSYTSYEKTQTDTDGRIDDFSASSYQNYQGEKLAKRFSPYSYYALSKAMDSHQVGRHSSVQDALGRISSKVTAVGITSDVLFPIAEQKLIAAYSIHGTFHPIESVYGHDGFLLEMEQINEILRQELC